MKNLTHLDSQGTAKMVDVGDKPATRRTARASAFVRMAPEARDAVLEGNLPKGEVFNTARLAGILAAKRVSELIPLTHSLSLDHVEVAFRMEDEGLRVLTEATVTARTGVEMEALTAASVAALTVYDMAKGIDRGMVISDIRLESKSGGRSGAWVRKGEG